MSATTTPISPVTAARFSPPPTAARLRLAVAVVGAVGALSSALGIGVLSSWDGHSSADETQYLLTALSLAEDGDLDISDESAAERWREFRFDEPPVQTRVLDDGRQVSPHDPLLPTLVAVPMGLGGWVGAKLTLCLLAGVLAGLTVWGAVRRFEVPLRVAALGVGVAAASAPFAVYGNQIYPELPAALAVTASTLAATGPLRRRGLAAVVVAVTLLPWLSVKYAPVAAALFVVAAMRWWRGEKRRDVFVAGGVLAAMAAGYLLVHQLLWGGWTVYATGDHFVSTGEFSVVGVSPDYLGRSVRLVGLLVDRGFGLVAWQPAWLLLPVALGFLSVRRRHGGAGPAGARPAGTGALLLPMVVGYLVATFVALTMHGYWWPGRQLVVVLPLALLLVLRWLGGAGDRGRLAALLLGLVGVLNYAGLLVDGFSRRLTWVFDFEGVRAPYQLLRPVLPDYRSDGFWALHVVWIAVLAGLVMMGRRAASRLPRREVER